MELFVAPVPPTHGAQTAPLSPLERPCPVNVPNPAWLERVHQVSLQVPVRKIRSDAIGWDFEIRFCNQECIGQLKGFFSTACISWQQWTSSARPYVCLLVCLFVCLLLRPTCTHCSRASTRDLDRVQVLVQHVPGAPVRPRFAVSHATLRAVGAGCDAVQHVAMRCKHVACGATCCEAVSWGRGSGSAPPCVKTSTAIWPETVG